MPEPVNPFRIGGEDVAGMDIDTRHLVLPGRLAALRHGRFPGSRSKFTIKGRNHYPTLVVYGPLRAATPAALHTLIQQHADAAGAIGSVVVYVNGSTFNNCDLVGFDLPQPTPVAYKDASGSGVKVTAQFTFEIVADPS